MGAFASSSPADDAAQARAVQALSSPAAYCEPPAAVEVIETHFAWVFLAGGYAYKLKKPMCFRELDLRTAGARRHVCSEEVRLSRRLAPDVYLGVAPLTLEADGSVRAEGAGAPIDWLVKMRRLPTASMLDRILAAGAGPQHLPALAELGRTLARFYSAQQRTPFEPLAYLRRMHQQIEADCDALREPELDIPAALVDTLYAAQLAACGCIERELCRRAHDGRIVEAHGDLRPEHVCLTQPPCVIDSLEFSFDLRTLDPLEELAYFWIECAHLSQAAAAEAVIDAWREASGDEVPQPLFSFYCSRRAAMRAKLIAWHLLDPQQRQRAPWSARAQQFLEAALRYARAVHPLSLSAPPDAASPEQGRFDG